MISPVFDLTPNQRSKIFRLLPPGPAKLALLVPLVGDSTDVVGHLFSTMKRLGYFKEGIKSLLNIAERIQEAKAIGKTKEFVTSITISSPEMMLADSMEWLNTFEKHRSNFPYSPEIGFNGRYQESMGNLIASYVGFSNEARLEFLKYVLPKSYADVINKLPDNSLEPIDSDYYAFVLIQFAVRQGHMKELESALDQLADYHQNILKHQGHGQLLPWLQVEFPSP
jgi:hypothetical protein